MESTSSFSTQVMNEVSMLCMAQLCTYVRTYQAQVQLSQEAKKITVVHNSNPENNGVHCHRIGHIPIGLGSLLKGGGPSQNWASISIIWTFLTL